MTTEVDYITVRTKMETFTDGEPFSKWRPLTLSNEGFGHPIKGPFMKAAEYMENPDFDRRGYAAVEFKSQKMLVMGKHSHLFGECNGKQVEVYSEALESFWDNLEERVKYMMGSRYRDVVWGYPQGVPVSILEDEAQRQYVQLFPYQAVRAVMRHEPKSSSLNWYDFIQGGGLRSLWEDQPR